MVKLRYRIATKPRNRRTLIERAQQLDDRIARAQPGEFDALIGDDLTMHFGEPKRPRVQRNRGFEVGHDDPDMVDRSVDHRATRRAPAM